MAQTPTAIVCIGMAGSGKTTFMQRINSHLHSKREPPYVINLDPAVLHVPFSPNIDIRDSVNYKEVMKQYNLGPNGGILTSLNLFATKIDQILSLLEKRCKPQQQPPTSTPASTSNPPLSQSTPTTTPPSNPTPTTTTKPIQNILIDTPGQIEVFVWSASGAILLDALASSFPTVIAYIIDTPRTTSTSTFMSNMLYACSILYKTKLPMILVFNKTDVRDADFAREWMTDFEAFQAALRAEEISGGTGGVVGGSEEGAAQPGTGGAVGGSGYMGSLLNSMSLMLEEFYRHLSVVAVSSMTGAGIDDFFVAAKEKAVEFERDYKPELERRQTERRKERDGKKEKQMGKLMRDMDVGMKTKGSTSRSSEGGGGGLAKAREAVEKSRGTLSDLEDEDSDEEDGNADIRMRREDEDMDDDEDEEDDDDDEDADADADADEVGLERRYKQALGRDGAGGGSGGNGLSSEDQSFSRYMRASAMNR
ncbi:hypothetical protein MMC25_005155 [Agyrium rufum]|nr:hypothetical protein [Agyrium rufum]